MKMQPRARRQVLNTVKRKPARGLVEALEQRFLLATWNGGAGTWGVTTGPNAYTAYSYPFLDATGKEVGTKQAIVHRYAFRDASGKNIWVYLGGAVRAEFVFSTVAGQAASLTGTYVPDTAAKDVKGNDLYAIYVANADKDSFIAIEAVEYPDNAPVIEHPYDGTAGTIRFYSPAAGKEVKLDTGANTGQAFLGARTVNPTGGKDNEDRPILHAAFPITGIGIMPYDPQYDAQLNGGLNPGLIVVDGQDLGKFIFCGTVTGQVTVGGSMDTFYAGLLLTGDATNGNYMGGGGGGGMGFYGPAESYFPGNRTTVATAYQTITAPVNFYVKHDLRNLLVKGSIGTIGDPKSALPDYITDFNMQVGGRVSQIKTNDSLVGNVTVKGIGTNGLPGGPTYLTGAQQELEARWYNLVAFTYNDPISGKNIAGQDERTVDLQSGNIVTPDFYNDTFDTAQYLGSFTSSDLKQNDAVQVQGTLIAETGKDAALEKWQDYADYYGVGLMAGQTVDVQLQEAAAALFSRLYPTQANPYKFSTINVGVFDPDGRLITSDYTDVDSVDNANPKIRFTADRPGVYRFAISLRGDNTFLTHVGSTGMDIVPYELTITNVKTITLGGIVAGNTVADPSPTYQGFDIQAGDLGGIYAGGSILSSSKTRAKIIYTPVGGTALTPAQIAATVPYSVLVENGNIRSIDGNNVGEQSALVVDFSRWIDISAPKGSVGLIRGRSTTKGEVAINYDGYTWADPRLQGYMSYTQYQLIEKTITYTYQYYDPQTQQWLTDSYDYTTQTPDYAHPVQGWVKMVPVAGDYQLISAADQFYGNVVCEGNIGIIRAGNMATAPASTMVVNASLKTVGGTIDLIDVAGDFGSNNYGGPQITTGPQGNVRYISVGGNVYRDVLFGTRTAPSTTFNPGQAASITDDSGAVITIKPSSGAALTVTTYPIRGSGGAVVIRARAASSMSVTSTVAKAKGSAEIGIIDMTGAAANAVLTISGTAKTDVLRITGGTFSNITNATPGELVIVNATSVSKLAAQTIGFSATSSTSSSSAAGFSLTGNTYKSTVNLLAINPMTVILNNFPFSQQHQGVVVSGAIGQVSAKEALGNISAGSIAQLIANSDNTSTSGGFEGIIGPVYTSGTMTQVNVGAGIPTSGAGNMAWSGLFAGGTISKVTANKADIAGIIAAGQAITTIQITSGSLIGANIWVGNLLDSRYIALLKTIPSDGDSTTKPNYEIGSVTVSGSTTTGGVSGGIIGTLFGAPDIGTVRVAKGFGVINCDFRLAVDGVIDRVEGDGLGLRRIYMDAGAKVNNIIASGTGAVLSLASYAPSVTSTPAAAAPASRVNNLYTFFNTEYAQSPYAKAGNAPIFSAATPSRDGISNSGIMSGVTAQATHDLLLLQAWRVEGGPGHNILDDSAIVSPILEYSMLNPVYQGGGPGGGYNQQLYQTQLPPLPPPSPLPPMKVSMFNFANSIKKIAIDQDIQDVQIISGSISSLSVGRDTVGLEATVAGPIGTLFVKRNVNAFSTVDAVGWNGQIGSLTISGWLYGKISAEYKIGRLAAPYRGAGGSILVNGKPV